MALISVSTLVSAGSMYYWYFVRLLEFKKKTLLLTIEMLSIPKEMKIICMGLLVLVLNLQIFMLLFAFFFCLYFITNRVKSYL